MVKINRMFSKPKIKTKGFILIKSKSVVGFADTLTEAKRKAKLKVTNNNPVSILKFEESGVIFINK